jgi:two-component system, LytTR family, sensor kinase
VNTNRIFNQSTKQRWLSFAIFWMVCGGMYITAINPTGMPAKHAFINTIVSIGLLAALSILIFNNMRFYLPKKEKYLYAVFISFTFAGIWAIASRLIILAILKQDEAQVQFLRVTIVVRFTAVFLLLNCITLGCMLWYIQKDQQQELDRKADMEKLAKDAELNKLRQQLQPHFLFNSLNSISALTGQQPDKARHMIQQLSDFFRGTIKNDTQQWVTLQDELEHLQLYLEIEKVRFGYRLQSTLICDAALYQHQLPSLLLQPLVENAIKFGLYDTIGQVEILIQATIHKEMLEISVQNPFDEQTSVPIKGTGFGLASVKRRLYLIYGRHDLVTIQKAANLYRVIIAIPLQPTHTINNPTTA